MMRAVLQALDAVGDEIKGSRVEVDGAIASALKPLRFYRPKRRPWRRRRNVGYRDVPKLSEGSLSATKGSRPMPPLMLALMAPCALRSPLEA